MAHELALWRALGREPLRLLQVTSTRFALLPDALFRPRPGLTLVRRWPALSVVLAEVTPPPARVYLAAEARVSDDDEAARQLATSAFVPGRSVLLAPGAGAAAAQASGDCVLEEDRPERLRLRCRASAPSFAVVADSWFPGWHALVDGQPAPIVRANLAMRAVPLPAGEHEVQLEYRPAHLALGFVVSGLALLALLALWLGAARQATTARARARQSSKQAP
jgi:hypothetical protein